MTHSGYPGLNAPFSLVALQVGILSFLYTANKHKLLTFSDDLYISHTVFLETLVWNQFIEWGNTANVYSFDIFY